MCTRKDEIETDTRGRKMGKRGRSNMEESKMEEEESKKQEMKR